ncbi:TetR/AcrR family transcriptional regulator [Sphingomonas sp. RS2018]
MLPLCNPYERRKDPQKVRAALIAAAARLIAEQGLGKLTVDAVARSAGVTKGGLFHHFPTKQDLLEGVVETMLADADIQLSAMMADDPVAHGAFTRAYLNGVLGDAPSIEGVSSRALCLATLADPDLSDRWARWVEGKLANFAVTDDNPSCTLVRLAADGAWLASLRQCGPPPPLPVGVYDALIALTLPDPITSEPIS